MEFIGLIAAVGQGEVERRLVLVLMQLTIIVVAARVAGWAFRKIGQPAVVGETAAGLVLGPSVLGRIGVLFGAADARAVTNAVFDPAVAPMMEILSQLGLVLLLFLIGMEFDFTHLKKTSKSAAAIALAGVALPFALGLGLAVVVHPQMASGIFPAAGAPATQPMPIDLLSFALFMGTAMSITAMPVLGRMMLEWKITRTRLGVITITAAAINDAIGWIILAAVTALAESRLPGAAAGGQPGYDVWSTVRMIGLTLAFLAFMMFAARPLLKRWIDRAVDVEKNRLTLNGFAVFVVILFLCSMATAAIGIYAIFGAFIFGAAVSDQRAFQKAIENQLQGFVTVFFLPIFFTSTGLRTDVGSLDSPGLWAIAGAVLVAAIAGKFVGCAMAARASGLKWREAGCVGIMMNTRGLMELIVINAGYQMKVIPTSMYCILVMMAMVTTLMTSPLLKWARRGTELDT